MNPSSDTSKVFEAILASYKNSITLQEKEFINQYFLTVNSAKLFLRSLDYKKFTSITKAKFE